MLVKAESPSSTLKSTPKNPDLVTHSPYKRTFKGKIPKIANKQIPLHSLGANLAHLPLSKNSNYRSKVWYIHRHQSNQEQQRPKSLYNRPVHLLKQYLERKEKLEFQPLITANPENQFQEEMQSKQFMRTANEFRIKRTNKRLLAVQPKNLVHYEPQQRKVQCEGQEMEFMSPNLGKNIYQMSQEELEQSIRWKKHFLETLNQKIRQSKTSSFTHRPRP